MDTDGSGVAEVVYGQINGSGIKEVVYGQQMVQDQQRLFMDR